MTFEELTRLYRYDPRLGLFYHIQPNGIETHVKDRPSKNKYLIIGDNKYLRIGHQGKRYYQHRLAWLYMTGSWPEHEIDHINGVRCDNRWKNLREATRQQNMFNHQSRRADLPKGVYRCRSPINPFYAQIQINGKQIYLGCYPDITTAKSAYDKSAKQLFGEFACR